MRKKILIVLLGAIGDVVRGLTIVTSIKKQWPDAEISWAIEPRSKSIIDGHSSIDKIFLFQRGKGFFEYLRFAKELRKEKFDIVLDLQRHFKSGFTSYYTGAKRRIGFNRANSKEFNWLFSNEQIEAVDNFSLKIYHYQLFLKKLGLQIHEPLEFSLEAPKESVDKISNLFDVLPQNSRAKRAAMILGSTWSSRFWFVEHYVKLINELYDKHGIVSVLVGANSERNFANEILKQVENKKVLDLVAKTSLVDLRALFKEVLFACGSDSGPMHIAAAMQTPVISFWGATSPKRSAPYGNQHLMLVSPISCSPCYIRDCPGLNRLCMKSITPEMVLRLVEKEILC